MIIPKINEVQAAVLSKAKSQNGRTRGEYINTNTLFALVRKGLLFNRGLYQELTVLGHAALDQYTDKKGGNMATKKKTTGKDGKLSPKLKKRMDKAIMELNILLSEVKEEYPNAEWYLNEDTLHLLTDKSHDMGNGDKPMRDRSIAHGLIIDSSGGGW